MAQAFNQSFTWNIWIVILIFGFICCMVLLLTLFFILYRFYYIRNKVSNRIKIYSILSLTFFLFAQLTNHFYVILVKLPGTQITPFTQNLWGVYNSSWSFGYLFTYLLFFERLKQTFSGSVHEMTLTSITIFYALAFCFIISQQSISIVWLAFVLKVFDLHRFNAVYTPALYTKFIMDLLLNIYIVYLFCRKIFKLTLDRTKSITPSSRRNINTFKNRHSHKIFDILIRYFLLTSWTVLSTQLFTVSQIVLSVAIGHVTTNGSYSFYYQAYYFHFTLGIMDSMVSVCYIILTFPFAKKCYNKLCNSMHYKCRRLWVSNQETEHTSKVQFTHETIELGHVQQNVVNSPRILIFSDSVSSD
eukprot:546506_1